jgi:hypothetical protein
VNLDNVVNSIDQGILATRFGSIVHPVQDIDKNGVVNSQDMLIIALNYNPFPC